MFNKTSHVGPLRVASYIDEDLVFDPGWCAALVGTVVVHVVLYTLTTLVIHQNMYTQVGQIVSQQWNM